VDVRNTHATLAMRRGRTLGAIALAICAVPVDAAQNAAPPIERLLL
jgi:hypothetical protein